MSLSLLRAGIIKILGQTGVFSMWLSPIFERFVEKSPVTVIVRTLMEVILAESKLDELFEKTAQTGYTA